MTNERRRVSTHFNAYCKTCEKEGPHIARSAGSTKLLSIRDIGFVGGEKPAQRFVGGHEAAEDWARFLVDHEYHDLALRHE